MHYIIREINIEILQQKREVAQTERTPEVLELLNLALLAVKTAICIESECLGLEAERRLELIDVIYKFVGRDL